MKERELITIDEAMQIIAKERKQIKIARMAKKAAAQSVADCAAE